jgi:hypothetical protein
VPRVLPRRRSWSAASAACALASRPRSARAGLGQLTRAEHQPSFRPGDGLCGDSGGQRFPLLVARGHHRLRPVGLRSGDRDQRLVSCQYRGQIGLQARGRQLARRQRTPIVGAAGLHKGPGLQGPHLTIAPRQQPSLPHALPHPAEDRHIAGSIRPLSGDHIGRHRQPQGIQGGQHHRDLGQVRAMVLAVAALEQPVFRDRPVAAGRGAIHTHALRLQVVHPQPLPGQRPLQAAPAHIVTQGLPNRRQPVIADIQGRDPLARATAQGVEPLLGPGLDMVQPVVRLRQNMAQPDGGHPAQVEAHPVAGGRTMLVQPGRHPHPLQLGQHQGDIVDTFPENRQSLGHAETFPQCSKPLQI